MAPSRFWEARHLAFVALAAGIVLAGTSGLGVVLSHGGLSLAESILLLLYGTLLTWITMAMLTAAFGIVSLFKQARRSELNSIEIDLAAAATRLARTAIVMPIYNEDVDRVFAGIRAMYLALRDEGHLEEFDFFILSDTTNAEIWLAEEKAWFLACRDLSAEGRLYYRHRLENTGCKSGNISEFCARWGRRYDYMVVLDADSVMSAFTLVRMVRQMDRDPSLGLLEVWPRPVNGASLFARVQQFGAAVYGPLIAAGLASLQLGASTYWGHNAIIRVRAFMECCGLPRLPGRPPWGGEILSHDFVEAALLVRAGWQVRLLTRYGGSYEEGPPTLLDHVKRDRRWCQGNLQHFRLAFARGLHPMSRVNLLIGVMAYLSAPLWFAFLALSLGEVWRRGASAAGSLLYAQADTRIFLALLALTAALLLLPKVFGLVFVLSDKARRAAHGGAVRTCLSVLFETVASTLVAPIMMVQITKFVVVILAGSNASWCAQRREAGHVRLSEACRGHALEMALGISIAVLAALVAPAMLWWFAPILAGLILAGPLSAFSASKELGQATRRWGLLLIGEESRPPPVLAALDHWRRQLVQRQDIHGTSMDPANQVILDPFVNALHRSVLVDRPPSDNVQNEQRLMILQSFFENGVAALDEAQRKLVLNDPQLLCVLRVAAVSGAIVGRPDGRGNPAGACVAAG